MNREWNIMLGRVIELEGFQSTFGNDTLPIIHKTAASIAELEAKVLKIPDDAEHAVNVKLVELNLGHVEAKKEWDKLKEVLAREDAHAITFNVAKDDDWRLRAEAVRDVAQVTTLEAKIIYMCNAFKSDPPGLWTNLSPIVDGALETDLSGVHAAVTALVGKARAMPKLAKSNKAAPATGK